MGRATWIPSCTHIQYMHAETFQKMYLVTSEVRFAVNAAVMEAIFPWKLLRESLLGQGSF